MRFWRRFMSWLNADDIEAEFMAFTPVRTGSTNGQHCQSCACADRLAREYAEFYRGRPRG